MTTIRQVALPSAERLSNARELCPVDVANFGLVTTALDTIVPTHRSQAQIAVNGHLVTGRNQRCSRRIESSTSLV